MIKLYTTVIPDYGGIFFYIALFLFFLYNTQIIYIKPLSKK